MPTMTKKGWLRLGTIRPQDLVSARLELHWGIQLPAAVGIARARPAEDFGQHALTWNAEHHALVSALVEGTRPYRAALRPADATLLLLNERNALVESLPLARKTLSEGLAWLEEAILRYADEHAPELRLPEHELPAHPIRSGAPFGAAEPAACTELARWFENLSRLLAELRAGRAATPLRVWSHHFDLDTVLDLGRGRTLGVGLSPGDEGYAEPYLYVLPTPYPEERALPPLERPFEWATDGWIGAVLRGSALATLSADEQASLTERFYRTATEALRRALGA